MPSPHVKDLRPPELCPGQRTRKRRRPKSHRISRTCCASLASRRDALVVVRPETMIRQHRAGWRRFWLLKSRPGRQHSPTQLTGSDPPHGHKESHRGRGAHRQCASSEARNTCLAAYRAELSSPSPTGPAKSRSALIDVPAPTRPANHRLRFHRSSNRHVSDAIRVPGHRVWPSSPGSLQRHRTSDSHPDLAAAA